MRLLPYAHLITLMLALCAPTYAQPSMYLFHTDTSGFPLIRAKVLITGPNGEGITPPNASDIIVRENGIPRPVIRLACPASPSSILSTVLAIDVSGSMTNAQQNGSANIDLAKTAAATWINAMPAGASECALVTFDERNYLNHDFTNSAAELLPSLNALVPIGGTSYDAGFIAPPAGSIGVAARGKNKRIVIFLTDGQGGGNEEKIVAAALKNNVTVYCVTLRMPTPPILQNIARRTGGVWFANVSSGEEIVAIYKMIMRIAQDPQPCEITWQSAPECRREREVEAMVPMLQASSHASYTAPERSVPMLGITPSSIAFGQVPPGTRSDTTIVLSAGAMPITVTSLTSSNPRFAIQENGGPITLGPGERREIRIGFTPTDSSLQMASFDIATDIALCSPHTVTCSGGWQGWRATQPTLRLLRPNGGDTLFAGSDTTIEWSGLLPEDTVRLEYSTDGGANWLPVTGDATGLGHRWHVPRTPSGRCLARVAQMPRNGGLMRLHAGVGPLHDVAFSPDGSRLILAGEGTEGELWDAVTGKKVKKIFQHGSPIQGLAYSSDGRWAATGGNDMVARIWDAASGALLLTLRGHTGPILSTAFSPDGRWMATGSTDRTVKIWETSTGVCIATLPVQTDVVRSVAFGPDGMLVACVGPDKTGKIWNIRERTEVASILLPNGAIAGFNAIGSNPIGFNTIDFNPNGNTVVTSGNDSTARIWDARTGALLRTLRGHRGGVLCARFSPDGKRIITGAADSTASLWEAASGSLLRTFVHHGGGIRAVGFSPSGRRVVTGSDDGTVGIWELDMSPLQQDVSDARWTIVASMARSHDADLGTAIVGTQKDSTIRRYVVNTGGVPVRVREIRIAGENPSEFALVSGAPPFVIAPGASADVELRFAPAAAGARRATVEIITVGDTLRQSIGGTGVEPMLEVASPVIDFGGVPVGTLRDTTVDVVLRNIGAETLVVSAIRREGPDTAQFAILGGDKPCTLAPGASHAMRLRFAPTHTGGTSGRIVFDYTGATQLPPAVASLFGEGVEKLSPSIELDRSIRFPDVRCDGSGATRRVLVRNNGRAPLTLSGAILAGKDAADFSLATPFAPATIPPGDSLTIALIFSPTGVGERSGWLTLMSDAPLDPAARVELAGRKERAGLGSSASLLDLGTVCPGVSPSMTLRVENTGTAATGVRLSAPAPFRIDRELIALLPGASASVVVTLPPMNREEDYWGMLTMVDTNCGIAAEVELRARVTAPAAAALPIEIEASLGSHADGMLVLGNSSGIDVTLTDALCGDPRFATEPGQLPLTIPAGESRSLAVRYTPAGAEGAATKITLLALPCGTAFTVEVRGTTVAGRGMVTLPRVEGIAGARVVVPVGLSSATEGLPVAGGGFTATIRFNASLLVPAGATPRGVVRDGERIITITGDHAGGGNELAKLEFIATLGDADSTLLHIDGFAWSDASAPAPELRDGLFSLRGLCHSGNARLVGEGTGAALKRSFPNPASGLVTVEFTTLEDGLTRLRLVDLLGRPTATLVEGELPPGAHTATLDLSKLAPGSYFYMLETPTELITRPMEVAR